MGAFNVIVSRGFDLFFGPFARANPWTGVTAVSFLSAVLLLLVFRHASNQRALRAARNAIMADLLEVVLYRDELLVVTRAQVRILRDSLRYLGHALLPILCMMLLAAVVVVQTDLRYGHRPLRVGERAIVAVKLLPEAGPLETTAIAPPPGIEVDSPALRIPSEREVDWRVLALAPGKYDLHLTAGGAEFSKTIIAGELTTRLPSRRVTGGILQQFLHPGERPLPSGSPVQWVSISYPSRSLTLLRWRLHWIWPWLLLSLAFGYILKGPLRIQV